MRYAEPPWDGTGVPPTPGGAPEEPPAGGDGAGEPQEPQTPEGEPEGGQEGAEGVEYPDGSTPPVDENGVPILEDRSAEFPEEAASATEVVGDAGFDPAEHTVAEVQAYLSEHPDQTEYVLERERAGKARTSLIGGA